MSHILFFICRAGLLSGLRLFLVSLPFLLVACTGDGSPQRIASYPAGVEGSLKPAPPAGFIYNALMELEVSDPFASAGRAAELAEENGGYLISSQTVRWERQDQVTVVLAVPAYNFESLHAALLRLGSLRFERISGEWDGSPWSAYSEVTVTFLPAAGLLPDLPGGWNPARTFRRAFEVFLKVFGFLADILIWVVVAIGPFVLLAWLAWKLLRRRKKLPESPE
jgi:hypothetical protein